MDELDQASSHIGSSPDWYCAWADSSMDNNRMSAVNRQGNESGFKSHTRVRGSNAGVHAQPDGGSAKTRKRSSRRWTVVFCLGLSDSERRKNMNHEILFG